MIYLLQIKNYTREHFVFMLTKQLYVCTCAFDSNCSLFYLATKRKWKYHFKNLNTTNSPEFVALYGSLFTFQKLGVMFYYIF